MANHRFGEIGFSESGPSNQPFGYGVHGIPAAANFFDQDGSAYFGELEEALMQGIVGIRSETDRKPFITSRPPTLEIFPSWPMRLEHTTRGNSQSADSIDSGSAQNTTISHQMDSAGSSPPLLSEQPPEQKQMRGMATDAPKTGAASTHKPQERLRRSNSEKPLDPKTLRRLAQNREAARKSRLRKKAYLQQLETSRIKLTQLEQDLQRARSQGLFLGGAGGAGGNISSGAAVFDMEYARWLNEDHKHMSEIRRGLTAHLPDADLRAIVDECLQHYDELFHLKCVVLKSDVFHLINGMWTSPAERCFLWMGGFRPSEMLKILIPQLDPLTDQQFVGICSLQQSSQQAEEALTQGLEQLQQSLADTVASGSLSDGAANDVGSYMGQMAIALGKLSNLEGFVRQADNLRQQTLHQLRRVLTIRQAARCFLAIGEYHNRLRAVSSLWASRPRENILVEENMCPTTSDMQVIHQQPLQNHFSAF